MRQRRRRGDQRLDRCSPRAGRVAAQNTAPGFDVTHDRMERTIGQVRRAVPLHDPYRLTAQAFHYREREPRFADARFARDMHDLPRSAARGAPVAEECIKLPLAADKGVEAKAVACVEAAL